MEDYEFTPIFFFLSKALDNMLADLGPILTTFSSTGQYSIVNGEIRLRDASGVANIGYYNLRLVVSLISSGTGFYFHFIFILILTVMIIPYLDNATCSFAQPLKYEQTSLTQSIVTILYFGAPCLVVSLFIAINFIGIMRGKFTDDLQELEKEGKQPETLPYRQMLLRELKNFYHSVFVLSDAEVIAQKGTDVYYYMYYQVSQNFICDHSFLKIDSFYYLLSRNI